jgi:hypothetical protein
LRISIATMSAAAFIALAPGSPARALPITVHSAGDAVNRPSVVQQAGVSQRKAATKAWFKRKGNQTANWFSRQKNKVEKKLAD